MGAGEVGNSSELSVAVAVSVFISTAIPVAAAVLIPVGNAGEVRYGEKRGVGGMFSDAAAKSGEAHIGSAEFYKSEVFAGLSVITIRMA